MDSPNLPAYNRLESFNQFFFRLQGRQPSALKKAELGDIKDEINGKDGWNLVSEDKRIRSISAESARLLTQDGETAPSRS